MTTDNQGAEKPPPATKRVKFDIGYCKPPQDNWFEPGTSGNPKGRPKGAKNKPPPRDKNLTDVLRDELFREVEGTLGGKKQMVSTLRAVMQVLINAALNGNLRAVQSLIAAGRAVEAADAAEQEADYLYAKNYKARLGGILNRPRPGDPELVPNPDQIHLDERRRRALFTGPRNREEKVMFDEIEEAHERAKSETNKKHPKHEPPLQTGEPQGEASTGEPHMESAKQETPGAQTPNGVAQKEGIPREPLTDRKSSLVGNEAHHPKAADAIIIPAAAISQSLAASAVGAAKPQRSVPYFE